MKPGIIETYDGSGKIDWRTVFVIVASILALTFLITSGLIVSKAHYECERAGGLLANGECIKAGSTTPLD